MKRICRRTALFLAMILMLSLALAAIPALAEDDESFDMVDFFSDTKLSLEPYLGKAVFLNFLTAWCPYCVQELPDIKKVFETYSREHLEIILVHVWDGEDASHTEGLKDEYGLHEMHFFEDEDMALARLVSLPGYPTSIFVDQQGNLAGAVPAALDFAEMCAIMDELGVPRADADVPAADKQNQP